MNKKLLLVITFLFVASLAFGQTVIVPSTPGCFAYNNTGCTVSLNVTSGHNAVVLVSVLPSTATPSVVTTNGDVFTDCGSGKVVGGSYAYELFCGTFNTTNSSEVITAQSTASSNGVGALVLGASGGYTVVDKYAGAASTSSGSTGTLSASTEIAFGFAVAGAGTPTCSTTGGWAVAATYTANSPKMCATDQITSATTALTQSDTGGDATFVVTLKYVTPAVATPTFSPVAGTYSTSPQSVTPSTITGGATLCFTQNGTTPSTNGAGGCTTTNTATQTYSSAIAVNYSQTLTVIGTKSGYTDSSPATAAYVVPSVAPTLSLSAGTYTSNQTLTISCVDPSPTIYYTVTSGSTGTTPTTSSTAFTGAITVGTAGTWTYEAICNSASTSGVSTATSATYTMNLVVPNPVITAATESGVTITESMGGAAIMVCNDAANSCNPVTQGFVFSGSYLPVFPYVRAAATYTGWTNSSAVSATVTATTPSFTTQPSVAWVSPSSIAATFVTPIPAQVKGYCSLTSGTELTSTVGYARSGDGGNLYTAGWERTSFTGTSTAWGNAVAITGLHQNTLYYCEIVAYDMTGTDSVTSSEFTATTAMLSTTPVIVNTVSPMTRLNDQYSGANGMPNNGFWDEGDTQMSTWDNAGNFEGTCHDCTGVGGAYPQGEGWFLWNSTHTIATQVDGLLGFGLNPSSATGWTDGGAWESTFILSLRGQLYYPLYRAFDGSGGYFNLLRSPDYRAHTISAGNQYAQGLGPNSALVSGVDIPVHPAVMPNNPLPNNDTGPGLIAMMGPVQNCQDESLNCVAQANNDGYEYFWAQNAGPSQNSMALVRMRVEDMPLMNLAKLQCYDGSRSGDDGLYDSSWTTTFTTGCTLYGTFGGTASGYNIGMLPNSQLLPDFNRYVFLNTVDNTNGGSDVLYDCGPYPWGSMTPIGSVNWDNDQFPGYYPSFGQIMPGSYIKTGTSPLNSLLMLTTTGTVSGIHSGISSPPTEYSTYIAKLSLVARATTPPRSQVGVLNQMNSYIASGLDLLYDFRGTTSLVSTSLPNLSPNDRTGAYSVGTSGFSNVTTGVGATPAGYFSKKGMYQFGFPPTAGNAAVITTPYNKSLSAFTSFVVFEHASSGSVVSSETVLNIAGSSQFTVYRNGTTANSWYVTVGTATVGPFTLTTDGAYAALVVRWDGTNVKVYSSPQIPLTGYAMPLATLATGTNTTAVSGTLYLGAATSGASAPFHGTLSDLLIYSRSLSDPELIREMNALRVDMASRGVTLP